MTFDEADKIVLIYGRYLEYCSHILMIFGARIPESFLPFPKDTLEKALNIMAEHYHKAGDQHRVKLMQEVAANLPAYVDDEEALIRTAKLFNDPKWRDAFLPVLKKSQLDWIKIHKNF
jgi:hypothetical protein